MKKIKSLVFLMIIIPALPQPSPHGFHVQYIGHSRYVSYEDEQKRDFCENFWCTNDAHYIFTKSSQYQDQDPCEDFKNFTIGKAWEIDAINDRYHYRGFAHMVQEKFWERERKVANEKFNPALDNRVIKIIKNTFKTCLYSRHTFRHLSAHKDILTHLSTLGSSPYLNKHLIFNPMKFNSSADYRFGAIHGDISKNHWKPSEFNLTKIIEVEPAHFLNVFMGLQVSRCQKLMLCLQIDKKNSWNWRDSDNYTYDNFLTMFENLEDHYVVAPQFKKILKKKMFEPTLKKLRKFLKTRNEIIEKFGKLKTKVLKLNHIGLNLDWKSMINEQVMKKSRIGEEDFVMVDGGKKMLEELIRHLRSYENGTLGDIFTVTFLYHHRNAFILRFYNLESTYTEGRKQSLPRWQRCLEYFHSFMRPALLTMYELRRPTFDYESGDFDRKKPSRDKIVASAEKFVKNAVKEAKKRFIDSTELPLGVAVAVLKKITNLKVVVGVTNKTLSVDDLEAFYDELELNGNEKFFESVLKMEKFHQKLKNEVKVSRRRAIDQMVQAPWIRYDSDEENVLYVSPVFIIYPAYHPLRPHFFNMASLFYYSVFYLEIGVRQFIESKFNITDYVTGLEFIDQFGYEVYKNWLKSNKELQIGANLLTNPQLYWVARALVNFIKFQRISQKFHSPLEQLQMKYLHIYYKRFAGFQEAFGCKFNARDLRDIFESVKKLDEIVKDENSEYLLTDFQKVIASKGTAMAKVLTNYFSSARWFRVLQAVQRSYSIFVLQ